MFNRPRIHFHEHGSQHVSEHREIHEHKAPTDKSIELLMEMERKLERQVLSVHSLQNNQFSAVWHVIEDHMTGSARAVCQLKLNGAEHRIEIDLEFRHRYNERDIAKQIHRAITEKLAYVLTVDLFTGAERYQLLTGR